MIVKQGTVNSNHKANYAFPTSNDYVHCCYKVCVVVIPTDLNQQVQQTQVACSKHKKAGALSQTFEQTSSLGSDIFRSTPFFDFFLVSFVPGFGYFSLL